MHLTCHPSTAEARKPTHRAVTATRLIFNVSVCPSELAGAGCSAASVSAVCRYVGPAQQRYGAYFSQILFSPSLRSPSEAAKSLRRIVFSPFDFVTAAAADPAIDGQWPDEDPQPFMVVYQHGRSVWAGPPDAQVGSAAPAWGLHAALWVASPAGMLGPRCVCLVTGLCCCRGLHEAHVQDRPLPFKFVVVCGAKNPALTLHFLFRIYS